MESDECIITIQGLEVIAHIGAPAEERAVAQQLLIDLSFTAMTQPESLHDDLSLTVDYAAVSQRIAEIVSERPRRLIETLADEVVEKLLGEFPIRWIELSIRKFILPKTQWVAVSIKRRSRNRI